MNLYIEHERQILTGMWRVILWLFGVAIIGLMLSGCYSQTRKARAASQYGNALTLKELVCRHVSVRCIGSDVLVRGKVPIWYLDGMRAMGPLIGHVNVNDVEAIDVCTRPSCLNMYPNVGSRYVIHIYTK